MSGAWEAIVWAAIAALFPACLHFGLLGAAPLRPPLKTRESALERLLFQHLWLLLVVNGLLAGCAVFFWKVGLTLPSVVAGLLAFPTIVAQLACAVIALSHWATGGGRRAAGGPADRRKAAEKAADRHSGERKRT